MREKLKDSSVIKNDVVQNGSQEDKNTKLPTRVPERSSSGGNNPDGSDSEGDTRSVVDALPRVDTPRLYKVVLLNDDYTPMDFVITVLKRFFGKSDEDASRIMMDVHHQGSGVAGVFSLEAAEMKVMQVNQFARQNQHPLKSSLEPE